MFDDIYMSHLAQSFDVVDCAGISDRIVSGFSNEGTNCPSFDIPDSSLAAQLKEVLRCRSVGKSTVNKLLADGALMYAEIGPKIFLVAGPKVLRNKVSKFDTSVCILLTVDFSSSNCEKETIFLFVDVLLLGGFVLKVFSFSQDDGVTSSSISCKSLGVSMIAVLILGCYI